MIGLVRGMRMPVVTIPRPSDVKTASNARVYLLVTVPDQVLTVVPVSCPLTVHERGVIDAAVALLSLDVAWAADQRAAVLALALSGRHEVAGQVAERLGLPLPEEPVRLHGFHTTGKITVDGARYQAQAQAVLIGSKAEAAVRRRRSQRAKRRSKELENSAGSDAGLCR
jgi:hypothetical protein